MKIIKLVTQHAVIIIKAMTKLEMEPNEQQAQVGKSFFDNRRKSFDPPST